jgi:hypothetical protein
MDYLYWIGGFKASWGPGAKGIAHFAGSDTATRRLAGASRKTLRKCLPEAG